MKHVRFKKAREVGEAEAAFLDGPGTDADPASPTEEGAEGPRRSSSLRDIELASAKASKEKSARSSAASQESPAGPVQRRRAG